MERLILFMIFLFSFYSLCKGQTNPCKKCDIETVKQTEAHLTTLSQSMVTAFLCTFDSSCSKVPDYPPLSNKVLFEVLSAKPALVINALATVKTLNITEIIDELEDPESETLDVKPIISKVNRVPNNPAIKKLVLAALREALDEDE